MSRLLQILREIRRKYAEKIKQLIFKYNICKELQITGDWPKI